MSGRTGLAVAQKGRSGAHAAAPYLLTATIRDHRQLMKQQPNANGSCWLTTCCIGGSTLLLLIRRFSVVSGLTRLISGRRLVARTLYGRCRQMFRRRRGELGGARVHQHSVESRGSALAR